MSEKKWEDIKYSSVPGSAMRRYKRAYNRNDSQRFEDWKNDSNSKASVSATYPHQVLNMIDEDEQLAEKLWNNLPDLITTDEVMLPMIDVSGSMFGQPLQIAISLGLYLAERNKSEFKNRFLTFSDNPQIVTIDETKSLADKFRDISNADWGMNTNFERAYKKILQLATSHNCDSDSMPTMLLVLSDMQFDDSQNSGQWKTHYSWMEDEYEEAGYKLPKIVFWDLNAYPGQPTECSDENVAMVSGFSPSIMKAVLNAEEFNPIDVMLEALEPIKLDYTNLEHRLKINYSMEY